MERDYPSEPVESHFHFAGGASARSFERRTIKGYVAGVQIDIPVELVKDIHTPLLLGVPFLRQIGASIVYDAEGGQERLWVETQSNYADTHVSPEGLLIIDLRSMKKANVERGQSSSDLSERVQPAPASNEDNYYDIHYKDSGAHVAPKNSSGTENP
jgi:hypothetical protein